jgi:alpha-tubulin suppressor-like RCC1 family protein
MGSTEDDRLGITLSGDYWSPLPHPMVQPLSFNEKISQMAVGGFGMIALSRSGSVFVWGRRSPAERQVQKSDLSSNSEIHPDVLQRVRKVDFPTTAKIVQISAGRSFYMALSDTGDAFLWHERFSAPLRLNTECRLISAGWDHCATVGSASDGPVTVYSDVYKPHASQKSYQVPSVRTIATGGGFTLLLNQDGEVLRLDKTSKEAELVQFPSTESQLGTKIRYISACFQNSSAISADQSCTVFLDVHKPTPIVRPDLSGRQVVQTVFGDWFGLALTEEGQVLSWGSSSKLATSVTQDRKVAGPVEGIEASSVIQTSKKTSYFAVQVAAGGWHSAILCCGDGTGTVQEKYIPDANVNN